MAIRAPGQYAIKKSNKRGRSHHKENRFLKKRFFTLSTNTVFPVSQHGKTSVTRLRARQNLAPALIGRTFNINQGDLNGENKETHRSFCFKIGAVNGTNCTGYFNGMYLARDKVANMVRKWHTLVDAEVLVTTKDESTWRVFATAVTRRQPGQTKKTSYIKSSQAKEMRRIMTETISEELNGLDTDKLMQKLSTESIGKAIELRCSEIYPMTCVLKKIKPIKNMNISRLVLDRTEDEQVEIMQEN